MIAELKKVNIIAPKEFEDSLLDALQSSGITHIAGAQKIKKKTAHDETRDALLYKLANIRFVLSFLTMRQKKKKDSLRQKLMTPRKKFSAHQIDKSVEKLPLDKIISTVSDCEKNFEQGAIKLEKIDKRLQELSPWSSLQSIPADTKYTESIAGVLPARTCETVTQNLLLKCKEMHIETLNKDRQFSYVLITYLKADRNAVAALSRDSIQKQDISILPSHEIDALLLERRRIDGNIKKWKKYIREMKKYIEPLQMADDRFNWDVSKLDAQKTITQTTFFSIIKVWVKNDDIKKLKNALKKISPKIFVTTIRATPKQRPPIAIENNSFFRPFESVTNLYGMPKYNEIDPTAYLAPFFIVFFALCLTDAGYGIILTIVSFAAIKIFKIPKENQRLFKLMGYGGIITIIVGALFGGWFGIDANSLQDGALKSFINFFRIIDPINEILKFMIISFALGIAQLWFAQIVKIIVSLKNHNKASALCGIAWTFFFLTGIVLVIARVLNQAALTRIMLYFMLGTVFVLLVTESLEVKNIIAKPFIGIIKIIQGLIGIMANTLSYSRLVALGLATGVIAFIFNTIAGIFRDLIPYVGWVVWVLMVVGGHIFNLGINALGAFIHSARLQFVEFFPNFMEGGGERFTPFKRHSKYFNIE
jgi:V/A-type H+-transporting ATPase subunit I